MAPQVTPYAVLVSWLEFWGAPILMIAISVAYFLASDRAAGVVKRAAWSSHGAMAAVIYFGAVVVWIAGLSRSSWGSAFLILQLLPLALIIYSLICFRGNRLVHFLQVPNALAMVWGMLVGGMAATGDWL